MKKILLILVIAFVLSGAGYLAYQSFFSVSTVPVSPAGSATASSTSALTQSYTNSTYHFSLMVPADFAASESPPSAEAMEGTAGETIVLQNGSGDGIQIVVMPFSEDTGQGYTLTKERILQDVPNLAIADEQPVVVGPNYTGLAFKSDNLAFDGASREVWFVFRGNLYQISTYARLDPLLQAIFKTWQFQ